MRKNWIAVASATHARRGCALPEQGFMQVCHGKCALGLFAVSDHDMALIATAMRADVQALGLGAVDVLAQTLLF